MHHCEEHEGDKSYRLVSFRLLTEQTSLHGTVVWYDPVGDYRGLPPNWRCQGRPSLATPAAFSRCATKSSRCWAGWSRCGWWSTCQWIPAETHNALAELEVAGVVLKPCAQLPSCNTRLSLAARHALAPLLGEAGAIEIERQVEAGQAHPGRPGPACRCGARRRRVGHLRHGTCPRSRIGVPGEQRSLTARLRPSMRCLSWSALLCPAFGLEVAGGETPADLRARLARHVLATDLVACLARRVAVAPGHRQDRRWVRRARRCPPSPIRGDCAADLRDSYVAQAGQVEQQLGLAAVKLTLGQVAQVETFVVIERALQVEVERALITEATDALIEHRVGPAIELLGRVSARSPGALGADCGSRASPA